MSRYLADVVSGTYLYNAQADLSLSMDNIM